jgi:hypothetical protein
VASLTRRRSRVWPALALAAALGPGVVCAHRPPGKPPQEWRAAEMRDAVSGHQRAAAILGRKRTDYQAALLRSLPGGGPYVRHLALERLLALGQLSDDAGVPALVALLEDTAPLPAELDGAAISNGALAAKVLVGREASGPIIDAMIARPGATPAVLSSLGPGQIRAQAVLAALARPEAQVIRVPLLRLALEAPWCGPLQPSALLPVVGLESDGEPLVRRLAPLAILRLSDCKSVPESLKLLRARATEIVVARLGDAADAEVVGDVALIARAGWPLVPALLDRLERLARGREQRRDLLHTLAGISIEGHQAAPTLVRLLQAPAERPLRADLLFTLGAVGGDPSATETLLHIAATDHDNFALAVMTLASSFATLTAAQLAPLDAGYRRRCAAKPSEPCQKLERWLAHLAEVGELAFDPIDYGEGSGDVR